MRYNYSLDVLKKLVSIPSVSTEGLTQPLRTGAGLKTKPIRQAAQFVIKIFKENGFNTFSDTFQDNQIIYAEYMVSPNKPTILFYNHYDVQPAGGGSEELFQGRRRRPADPLDEWLSEPFNPTIRSGKLFGRGVSDNKGNLIARLAAVKSLINSGIPLQVNIKFLIDGGEEIGSPGLSDFIRKYRSKLTADLCIWEHGKRNEKGIPELSLGVKGILYVELLARGPREDLHSSRAIIVPNPAWRLTWALDSLKDPQERILIKGFYDDCLKPADADIKILSAGLLNEEETKKRVGIKKFLLGLSGKSLLKRYLYQPALNIDGLTSGYQGAGQKTVLPKQASAKIDFRLVPNQKPRDILKKLRNHLDNKGFSDIKITSSNGYRPAQTPLNHPLIRKYLPLLNTIAGDIYGHKFIIEPLSPASSPMYLITSYLKIPCLSFGISHPGANLHAPNENIYLSDYHKGVRFLVELFKSYP